MTKPRTSGTTLKGRMVKRGRWLAAWLVALVVVAAGVYDYSVFAAEHALFQARAQQLQSSLAAADGAGYSPVVLAQVQRQLQDLKATPLWRQLVPGSRLADQVSTLSQSLAVSNADELAADHDRATQAVSSVSSEYNAALQAGVDPTTLSPLTAKLDTIQQQLAKAVTPLQLAAVQKSAQGLLPDLVEVVKAQTAADAAIGAAAGQLETQMQGNLAKIQAAGNQSLAAGRNDATVASYEALPGRFPAIASLMARYHRMESYVTSLGAKDLATVAFAAAAIQYYAAEIHQDLIDGLGPQHLIVSFTAQHVWAYQNGQVVMNTPVTTGVRGVTDVGTDFGPMKVLSKNHPWTFVSPWPITSPLWYPNTTVNYATFFTDSGESFHDAYWEPDSALGPGSQYQPATESHGCVHVPLTDAQWIYNWAQIGTPVDVYPGDGQPVSAQLAEITTTNQGVPLHPA